MLDIDQRMTDAVEHTFDITMLGRTVCGVGRLCTPWLGFLCASCWVHATTRHGDTRGSVR